MDAELPLTGMDAIDCAPHAAAAAGDTCALKGGTGGGRCDIERAAVPERNFSVCADVAQKRSFVSRAHPACQNGAGDISADKGVHAERQVGAAVKQNGVRAEKRIGLKRGPSQGNGVASGQKIKHCGVSGKEQNVGLGGRTPGVPAGFL